MKNLPRKTIFKRFFKYIIFLGVLFIVITKIASYFTINYTPSYPIGVYFKSNVTKIERNHYYLFCPTYDKYMKFAETNKFWENMSKSCGKTPMYLKKAYGLPGDYIEVKEKGVFVNGVIVPNSQIVLNNKIFKKNYSIQLKENEYFMLSDYNKHSYDSRYFGIINKNQILKQVYPVLTEDVLNK